MKLSKLFLTSMFGLFLVVTITSCNQKNKESEPTGKVLPTVSKQELENEAWKMEEKYWDYVQKNDTITYKTLWHNDFIGYPTFGEGVSNKSQIAIWIPKLHVDSNLKFSYKLYKKGVNAIEDVVIAFYDVDFIWTDTENNMVRKVTKKVTHTWKNYDETWLILGGMSADKNQDISKN